VEVDSGVARLRLPSYFLDRVWEIPLDDAGVLHAGIAEMTALIDTSYRLQDGLELPYFFTATATMPANLAVLFRTAQRIPPLRYRALWRRTRGLSFGVRETRSSGGLCVDGILLRSANASEAVDTVVAFGAERVTDPVDWFAAQSRVRVDMRVAKSRRQANRRAGLAQGFASLSFAVGAASSVVDAGPWRWLVGIIALVLLLTAAVFWIRARTAAE
jgi:hypothetical protein